MTTSTRIASISLGTLLGLAISAGLAGYASFLYFDVATEVKMLAPIWVTIVCAISTIVLVFICVRHGWPGMLSLSLVVCLCIYAMSLHVVVFNALTGELWEGVGPVTVRSIVLEGVDDKHYCYESTATRVTLRVRGEPPLFSTFSGIWPIRIAAWFPFPTCSEHP